MGATTKTVKRVCNCLLGQQATTIYPRSEMGRILTVGCPVHDPERRKALNQEEREPLPGEDAALTLDSNED